jgi:hypothetical protein
VLLLGKTWTLSTGNGWKPWRSKWNQSSSEMDHQKRYISVIASSLK